MELASYIQVLLYLTAATQMAYCNDIYFAENRYHDVSEDVGSIFINVSSRAVEDKEAFFDFYDYYYYYYYYYYYDQRYAIPGVDYEFQNITNVTMFFNFTIPAGSTRSFEMTIIDDSIAEYRFKRLYYDIGVYDSFGLDYCDYGRIFIEDNEGLRFELLRTGVTVDEDVGSVELCVTYRGVNLPPTVDATIRHYSNLDDIIFNGANFTLSNGGRICFDVIVVDDDEIEYQENYGFDTHFQNGSSPIHFYDYTQIHIIDNEAFRFGFERSSYSVLESEGVVTVCVTADRGDGSEVLLLNIFSVNVTTQEEVDHGPLPQQDLTISANLTKQCVNITIIDDTIPEENEIFQISISSSSRIASFNPYQRLIGLTTVTIFDDDLTCSPECVNGVCIYPGVCLCDEGWIDEDCSREVCPVTCMNGGRCNVNTGYCDCPPGYTGIACDTDIPECDTDNGGCQQICNDFLGGYNCSCREGFRPLNDDQRLCEDLDECLGDHDCSQMCVNSPGSYNCNCERGFQLINTTECEDVDECSILPNGFCGQMCINTHGSYHCDCREGYRLSGMFFCEGIYTECLYPFYIQYSLFYINIDECMDMSDDCSRTEPVAQCINLEGSYKCSCDHHTGYRLNGTVCEDINECEEGRHICTGLCVNTAGSHHCSCSEGFVLDTEDMRTCHDIDECNGTNGGCQHSCTNTFGSFNCSCSIGYELLDDGLMCAALSCDPPLEAPENGSIVCDNQTVGGTCSFQCNEGYTLRGSTYRTCSPSLQWSGRPAICDPPTCPKRRPPQNGFVLFPCSREEGDTCSVVCAHGFTTMDPTNQICEKNDSTDSLLWSMGPHCEKSNPCSDDPCMNGGVCLEDGNDFSCSCNGTGYGGPTCQIAIIFLDYIPPPTIGTEFQVRVFTKAILDTPRQIEVTVQRSGRRKLSILPHLLKAEYTVAGELGIITVSMPSNKEEFMYEPQQRTVFISGGSRSDRPSYFDQLNLPRGQLKPGCCTHNTDLITCPASTQTISFQSSCQWVPTQKAGGMRSPGIVFAEGNSIALPTSISGLRYRGVGNFNLVSSELPCMSCDGCVTNNASQYNFTLSDLPDLLSTRALGFTYIQEIQQLLPSWLNMFVDLDLSVETSPLTRYDSFAPTTRPTDDVADVEGCGKLVGLTSGVYSVLRYDKTLTAVINGTQYDYSENTATGITDDPMCFAVDLCDESGPPVHMQISQPINDILVSQYLRRFSNRQWRIHFNTVSVFSTSSVRPNTIRFWNGMTMITPPEVEVDVSVNSENELVFSDENGILNISIEFTGDAAFNYQERRGLLDGQVSLVVDSTINGVEHNLQMRSSKSRVYCEVIPGDPCDGNDRGLIGISFRVNYERQPEEFFTRLLRFTEITQSCIFEAFLPVDENYKAYGLNLYTECPLLAIGELVLPEMTHTVNFIRSTMPDCFPHETLGIADRALVIQSRLINDHLRLGNILELQSSNGLSDITTVFGRSSEDGFVSELHSVQVTLFNGMFTAEATISNNQLTIHSGEGDVFGYGAELHITAPANETDWDDLFFTINGNLGNRFVRDLLSAVNEKLERLAKSGNSRQQVARNSLDQSSRRLASVMQQLNDAESNVTKAAEELTAANEAVQTAQVSLTEIELEFNASSDDLRNEVERLNRLCTEEFCEDVCMAGELCRNCSRATFVTKTSKCPTTITEIRNMRVPPFFVTRTTWRFVLECRLENGMICYDDQCPINERDNCYGKCVPVVDSLLPVYHWRAVEVKVNTFENCTINIFNASVPDTCCEEVNCAVFAPNASCVMRNAMCRADRQNASDTLRNESRALFQQLQEARTTLSLARTAAKRAEVEYDIYEQRRDQLQMSLRRLENANKTAGEVYQNTLDKIGPLLKIAEEMDGFQSTLKVISITFSAMTTNSPTALDLNVIFEANYTRYEESYVYIASHKKENFDRIADDIIDLVFFTDSKRAVSLQARNRRQVTAEMTQREIFASRCVHISNIQQFLMEIETKLTEVQVSVETSREGSMQLSQSLSDQGPPADQEFAAYLELIRDYEDFSVEALRALESTIFSEWQASMELLYSESASVGEVSCDGFADCLQTAMDELQNLIDLTPEHELNENFVSLQQMYSMAVRSLLELALLSNISINGGLDRIGPIIEIMNTYATDNYWCNEPPVIISDLPPEVNISLSDTLNLLCEATSSLSVTYEWRRDGNVLPQYTTHELVITSVQRLDSANYTCFANNPVGSAESITTSVTVYERPQFYLLPQSVATYFGDGNGAWFACNASAWPYPGWRWYHRSTADQEWMVMEGEETNELLILNPQKENEGMYACEAFNYHGSVRSEPVTLTLLPFTVSQQKFPLEFSIFMNGTGRNQSCSLDDLYDTLYSLVDGIIDEQTSIIEDFNITQVDGENYDISLSLLSTDVTTHYLHLLTFTEIANVALPHVASLRKSIELITDVLDDSSASYTCIATEFSVVEGSLVVGKRAYVCPLGQRLNTDYLLCLSCERGQFSTQIERSRIVNGVGFSENIPVCRACPLETYADELGSSACLPCPRYHSTLSTGTTSAEECLPQPLLLECDASNIDDHITIDCRTNRPTQNTLCSFDNGLLHPCSYPLSINRDVSPLGNHSLTISVKDGEGFQAETALYYFLEDDTKPTLPAAVPSLVVSFTNDSPRVLEDSVEADILLSRPVQSLVCRLKGGSINTEQDCSAGHVVFSPLPPAVYTLRVVATNRVPDREFTKSRFEITRDTERCTLHLINSGVTVTGDSASVEFTGRGPIVDYHCSLDRMPTFECSSPVVLSGLSSGEHQLKVVPAGCGRNRMNLKTKINIP